MRAEAAVHADVEFIDASDFGDRGGAARARAKRSLGMRQGSCATLPKPPPSPQCALDSSPSLGVAHHAVARHAVARQRVAHPVRLRRAALPLRRCRTRPQSARLPAPRQASSAASTSFSSGSLTRGAPFRRFLLWQG
eukprot:6992380-Prymnesium_polylepis.1